MATPLEEKRINRLRLLKRLYDAADEVSERASSDIHKLGHELGMDEATTLETFNYLKSEGLTETNGSGRRGKITHKGVKEVEDAQKNIQTPHFPANSIIITDSPGARVETGVRQENNQMATIFDQRGQHVNYQYNAAGNINVGAVQNNYELAAELEKLEGEIAKAREAQAIDKLTASKATTPLLEAAEEAKKPEPDKKSLLSYLGEAKDTLKGIAAIGGIVEAVTKAYEWVEKML